MTIAISSTMTSVYDKQNVHDTNVQDTNVQDTYVQDTYVVVVYNRFSKYGLLFKSVDQSPYALINIKTGVIYPRPWCSHVVYVNIFVSFDKNWTCFLVCVKDQNKNW